VVCLSPQVATVYRPRQPRQSPLYRLIERYYPEFERSYGERYQQRYGTWRPIIGEVARKFLRCGDLHFGFARVRCTGCPHEMFVHSLVSSGAFVPVAVRRGRFCWRSGLRPLDAAVCSIAAGNSCSLLQEAVLVISHPSAKLEAKDLSPVQFEAQSDRFAGFVTQV
jgi:hypothetical protein